MRCREATALLSAALDDELDAGAAARVRRHLERCASCRSDRDAFDRLRAWLRVAEPVAVDLVPALWDRLAGEPEPAFADLEQTSPRPRPRRRRLGRAFVGVVAAAATIAATVAFVRQNPVHVTFSTAKAAAPELQAPSGASLLLVWTSSGLPAQALEHTRSLVGVTGATEVRGDELGLTGERDAHGISQISLPPGDAIPIDALAIDPVGYSRDLPKSDASLVRTLPRDGALLGETSARLRGVGVGGSLTFGATTVRVTGVVADSLVGAAEVVVPDDSPLAVATPRFLLLAYRGDRSDLERAVEDVLHRPVRFRAPGETPYLRQGDAVLPQALIKERFGEFWYRTDARGNVTIDPRWVARNVVTIDVPGIGRLRVDRLVAPALRGALATIARGEAAGGPGAVSAFAPQMISGGLGLSRHTWGIALTLPDTRRHTISVMAAAGFRWGGLWLNRSLDYYEWVGNANY